MDVESSLSLSQTGEREVNKYQNMDKQAMSEELEKMTKDRDQKQNDCYAISKNLGIVSDKYGRLELESQKWRDKCVGLEASNKLLCEQKEELLKRCQYLNKEQSDPIISKEEYAKLVKENERLNVLTGSFFNVFIETYRRVQPYTKGGQDNG